MNTNEMPTQDCFGSGKKHKKFLITIGLVSLVIAVAIISVIGMHSRFQSRMGAAGFGIGRQGHGTSVNNITYEVPRQVQDGNQFVAPGDAAETGQLAETVDSIDGAKKTVSDIATNNNGNVYSTFIAYSSNSIENGSMVVQVPIENFDTAFAALRNVGKSVVQESTQQIEQHYAYPVMQPAAANSNSSQAVPTPDTVSSKKTVATDASETSVAAVPTSAAVIAPYPSQVQDQDKGYIKIVFADYGMAPSGGNQNAPVASGAMRFQDGNQSSQNVLLIGFVIKLLLLIVMLGLLFYIFRKIVRNLRLNKSSGHKIHTRPAEKKTVAHVVRQTPRTRIINIKKK